MRGAAIGCRNGPKLYSKFPMIKAILVAACCALMSAGAELPRKAADIDITLPDGQKVSLEQYRGKVVCLAFILTT